MRLVEVKGTMTISRQSREFTLEAWADEDGADRDVKVEAVDEDDAVASAVYEAATVMADALRDVLAASVEDE